MGQYAVKVECGGRDYYLHWSEIVDAPVHVAVSLEDYREYFKRRFGTDSFDGWTRRGNWERLESRGVSTLHHDSAEAAMSFNRAGPNEESLTYQGILERYCKNRTESGDV